MDGIVRRVRYAVPILGVLVLVGLLVAVKASQIGMLIKAGKAAEAAGPPPEAVGSAVARKEDWEATLSAVGSVETNRGVVLSVEVPGVVTAIRFESGGTVKRGDVLVELDASVERAQLASATARKQLATTTLARNKTLAASNAVPAAQLESDESALRTAEADVLALQAQIAKKVVRAPFPGKLGIREVNLGQYLNPGARIAILETTEGQYVDFTLPQADLDKITLGTPVRLGLGEGDKAPLEGAVAAISPTIDPVTRSMKIRASAKDPEGRLRPGMFVRVAVVLGAKRPLVSVPVTAIVHASYGDSLFVIESKQGESNQGDAGKVARQRFVRVGETRGDFVAIEEGLQGGEEVVVAGAFKLRNGAPVVIKNDVAPAASIAPAPENR